LPEKEFQKKWLKTNALQAVRDKNVAEGIRLYREYLGLEGNAEDDDAWAMLGGAYRRAGDIGRAVESYAKAFELKPTSTYAAVNLVFLKATRDELAGLETEVAKAIALTQAKIAAKEDDHWTWFDLGMLQLLSHRIDDARTSYRFAADMKSSTPENVASAANTLELLAKSSSVFGEGASKILAILGPYLPK
jgi:cytochrome c-type biogenesis protein CcmH/NrfG